jgi:hypothetical protein
MGKKQEQQETPQQRAMVEHAVNQFADWKQRWLPVQKNLMGQIQAMGKPGSQAREDAAGRASTDSAIQFGKAQGALQKSLANTGAGAGSAKFNLGVTGAGEDQAKSKAFGLTVADQQINDAYVEGLSALAATGRGERAQVGDSLGRMAAQSSRQAAADAESSAIDRASTAGLVGQVAGFGLQQSLGSLGTTQPVGSVSGGYNIDGRQFNNPSAYIAPGG